MDKKAPGRKRNAHKISEVAELVQENDWLNVLNAKFRFTTFSNDGAKLGSKTDLNGVKSDWVSDKV